MYQIQIKNLTKIIKGKTVLDNINCSLEAGKIYGMFGRNGSGKTMLLRVLSGLVFPTEGQILYNNKILHKDMDFPENMGIIIENMELYPQFDAFTNLKLLAKINNRVDRKAIMASLERVGLEPDSKKKAGTFSLGMKQKLSIAQAIFEKPDVLLLDEPTNGLDEESVKRVRNILLEEKERGCLILLASHNKEDLMTLSDVYLEMKDGRIKMDDFDTLSIGKKKCHNKIRRN